MFWLFESTSGMMRPNTDEKGPQDNNTSLPFEEGNMVGQAHVEVDVSFQNQ